MGVKTATSGPGKARGRRVYGRSHGAKSTKGIPKSAPSGVKNCQNPEPVTQGCHDRSQAKSAVSQAERQAVPAKGRPEAGLLGARPARRRGGRALWLAHGDPRTAEPAA